MRLTFGSEEMKEALLLATHNPETFEDVMELVYQSVREYTIKKLMSGFEEHELRYGSKPLTTTSIPSHEYDDIVNDVMCKVTVSLNRFIENIELNNEAQRQSWLRTIVYNAIADYYKKLSKSLPAEKIVSLEEWQELHEQEIGVGSQADFQDFVRSLIKTLCKAKSKSEKILAYIFNVILFKDVTIKKQNASSNFTSEYMDGKQLFVLKCKMVDMMSQMFDVELTDDEIKPLNDELGRDKPTEKGMEICSVTPRLVTDWTNRMKTYVFKHRLEINGLKGDSDE